MSKEMCGVCREKIAVWNYVPAHIGENPFYCDNCVPRGCSCNTRHISDITPEDYDGESICCHHIKYIVDESGDAGGYWCDVDDDDREYPCCEYDYDEDGYE